MAGMASGNDFWCDAVGHSTTQIAGELRGERAIRREFDERWEARSGVSGDEQSDVHTAAEPQQSPALEPRELFVAVDDGERLLRFLL